MQPTTPTGSRTTSELPISSSQTASSITCGIEPNDVVGRPAWIIFESFSGIPTSHAISAAISSLRSARPAAIA